MLFRHAFSSFYLIQSTACSTNSASICISDSQDLRTTAVHFTVQILTWLNSLPMKFDEFLRSLPSTGLVILNRSATKDRLVWWISQISSVCPFCESRTELGKPLVFWVWDTERDMEGSLATYAAGEKAGTLAARSGCCGSRVWNKLDQVICKLFFTSFIYCTWKERNLRFHCIGTLGISTLPMIKYKGASRLLAHGLDSKDLLWRLVCMDGNEWSPYLSDPIQIHVLWMLWWCFDLPICNHDLIIWTIDHSPLITSSIIPRGLKRSISNSESNNEQSSC